MTSDTWIILANMYLAATFAALRLPKLSLGVAFLYLFCAIVVQMTKGGNRA